MTITTIRDGLFLIAINSQIMKCSCRCKIEEGLVAVGSEASFLVCNDYAVKLQTLCESKWHNNGVARQLT